MFAQRANLEREECLERERASAREIMGPRLAGGNSHAAGGTGGANDCRCKNGRRGRGGSLGEKTSPIAHGSSSTVGFVACTLAPSWHAFLFREDVDCSPGGVNFPDWCMGGWGFDPLGTR